ncbi:dienelactone hydrolase family protein [Sphingomonas histidinilytica]|uniref:dienelactone hydrolase family protein n=1 Tax=Rhizorhabdus histidinilytica TaxID=439228 RepID=UPI001AD9AB35|nr:dienelactone hydrolase family protein [Rhizorhabdus histidinilytica]MBO9378823.1 dienelactone hydrolase family protein [Rhizorhabdus histidinilytica]
MLNFNIHSVDGDFGGYLTGAGEAKRPGIVLLQEIFGVNDAMRLAADQFAADGFVVLVPDLFHQSKPGIELGYSDADRDQAIAIWQSLDDDWVARDTAAAIAALRVDPSCNGKVAAVGFCLGGKHALLAASIGIVDAAVSFYPVQVASYQDQLKTFKCPVQVQVGDADSHAPEEVREILAGITVDRPENAYHLHAGAGHGFYNSVRSFGFHPEAAALAHGQAVDFIKQAFGAMSGGD